MNRDTIKIIVGGMGQSGSTGFFNLIRWVCMDNDLISYSCVPNQKLPPQKYPEEIDVIIQKDHFAEDAKPGDIVFTTKRDIRDCAASTRRKSGMARGLRGVFVVGYHNIWMYERLVRAGAIPIQYEKMTTDLKDCIKKIANILKLSRPKTDWAIECFNRTAAGEDFESNYKATAYVSALITNRGKIGGHKDTLADNEIELMSKDFGWWLYKEGYEIGNRADDTLDSSFSSLINIFEQLFGKDKKEQVSHKIQHALKEDTNERNRSPLLLIDVFESLFGKDGAFGKFWSSSRVMLPGQRSAELCQGMINPCRRNNEQ